MPQQATRAGMGGCHGGFRAATIAGICRAPPDPEGFAAPRAPVRLVPAAALMREAPEFTAPLLPDPAPPVRLHALPPLPVETRHTGVAVIGAGVAGPAPPYFPAKGRAHAFLIDPAQGAAAPRPSPTRRPPR